MPRGIKPKKKPTASETNLEDADIVVMSKPQEAIAEGPAVPPPAFAESSANESVAARGRFRSWVVDTRRGYTGLTDEENHYLVLQFVEKPQPDVLAAIKGAGFQFRPDHAGLKNAWVRRNDFEGRLQVEAIERLIREVSAERESVAL